jgi:hypothetical protein
MILFPVQNSECHGYRYTHGFHAVLAVGTSMGTKLLTPQKPIPVPIIVMHSWCCHSLCHNVTQPNMAITVSHESHFTFTTTTSPVTNYVFTGYFNLK